MFLVGSRGKREERSGRVRGTRFDPEFEDLKRREAKGRRDGGCGFPYEGIARTRLVLNASVGPSRPRRGKSTPRRSASLRGTGSGSSVPRRCWCCSQP